MVAETDAGGSPDGNLSGSYRVIVHGGAWAIDEYLHEANRNACREAVLAAVAVLERPDGAGDGGAGACGSALDAVEAAIRVLEDDASLDAGRGSWLNELGQAELDALIMDGDLRAGGVAAVTNVDHPITLARRVMERTEHVLLVGAGANRLAVETGLAESEAPRADLITPEALKNWERYRQYSECVNSAFCPGEQPPTRGHDTVGCVVLDKQGRLAAGTSTGGVTFKKAGRVGDSPLIGSGAYCDRYVGGASATGHGEAIARVTLCRHALWLLEQGGEPARAAALALERMRQRCGEAGGGTGGLILCDRNGRLGHAFTTKCMAWASASWDPGMPEPEIKAEVSKNEGDTGDLTAS
eukprot:TRINITY_DN1766_c0_g1_i1.p1 TRINITY_DN1766_c0_g1~~TRINITY_DN1766_c0_g1_i1.p1  ORF type:complete len:380 (+),score=96.86 TRINITY_DN1766_c0_g1_i1:78-1142(+)